MARWDDLYRAIEAKDTEGTERLWLELIEADPGAVDRFVAAAAKRAAQSGGKREAGILLWLLAESLKDKGRDRELIRVYSALARTGPDDGTLRTAMVEAVRRAYADRPDLDALLQKSGVVGGTAPTLGDECEALERYLQLEPGAFVFHRSGWGTGRIVEYAPERGRCVIDFKGRPGHAMDIDTAAKVLERLPETDIRALAFHDPAALKAFVKQRPLDAIRQILDRFKGSAPLRHVKDALVPDAVSVSGWSDWWKEARRQALIDPRFQVGTGRDPRIEFHEAAQVNFRLQVEKTLKACGTPSARQQAVRDLLATVGPDADARAVLVEATRSELERAKEVGVHLAWQLVLAEVEGRDPFGGLRSFLAGAQDPCGLLAKIADEGFRALTARALVEARPDGPDLVLAAALKDDPVVAEAAVEGLTRAGRDDLAERLLTAVDESPLVYPNLFAWFSKGLRRGRWPERAVEPYALAERVLKVMDAVEYRARRAGAPGDKTAVATFESFLSEKSCGLLQDAAVVTDDAGARHLMRLLEKNLALKGRLLQRLQDVLLHAHPTALREPTPAEVAEAEGRVRSQQVWMSRAGLERLRAEHDRIVNQELPANAAEIARAREFGDLRENAEYHAAREKHGLLKAKADAMKAEIMRAVVLTPDVVRTDAVSVGTRVRLRDADGTERTYQLMGPPDTDVEHGVINYLTPLGQALMGRRPGDRVSLELSGETRDLEVLAIESAIS